MKSIVKWICLLLATIFVAAICYFPTCGLGTDRTKEYNLYEKVCKMEDINEVTRTLENEKVDYIIENLKLTIKGYKNISFDISLDNSCKICDNKIMKGFEILDTNNRNQVIEKGVYNKKNNKYEKSLHFNVNYHKTKTKLTKMNNAYYCLEGSLFVTGRTITVIFCFLALICTGILIYNITILIKPKKKTETFEIDH